MVRRSPDHTARLHSLTFPFFVGQALTFITEIFMRSIHFPLAALLFLLPAVGLADDVKWKRVQLDPAFRAEGVTAFDVNKDGKIDVVGGEVWYEAPDWHMHEIRPVKKYDGATGYSNSFACFNYDVNADGWNDLICIGFPGVPCHWFENPKGMDTHWKQYEIWHSAANESPQFKDLNADGRPELVMSSETEGIYGYLEIPRPEKCQEKWEFVAVSEAKLPTVTHRYYHGLGVTDVNRDGRNDIVIPHGWWEQPADLTQRPWKFHAHTLSRPGNDQPFASADIYADDLDLDGDNELIHSSATPTASSGRTMKEPPPSRSTRRTSSTRSSRRRTPSTTPTSIATAPPT